MILRRWEVRARDLQTMEGLTQYAVERYFFRRHAEDAVRNANCVRLIHGFKNWTYYVHDRQEDGS